MENRTRMRLPFKTKVQIKNGPDSLIKGEARDVSMSGLFVVSESIIPLESPCEVDFLIEGNSSQLRVKASAVVSRHDNDGFGVRFNDDLEWLPIFAMFGKYGR